MDAEHRTHPDKTFEVEMANQIGVVVAGLSAIMERNRDLPLEARTRLVRLSWKLMPFADATAIRAMRVAYEPWLYSPEPWLYSPEPSESPPPEGMPS